MSDKPRIDSDSDTERIDAIVEKLDEHQTEIVKVDAEKS